MTSTSSTPVTRSRSSSIHSYGTTTIAAQSRNESMYKIPTITDTVDEDTPLLAANNQLAENHRWAEILKEAWILIRYAAPTICTMLLEYSFLVVSVVTIGHISTEKLAGAALGEITAGVTGFSIIQGFACALDALLPQAWTGGNPSHVGLWAQRMMVLMVVLMIPVLTLWLNAKHILLHLRQDPVVAGYAALYLKYSAFQLPGYVFNSVVRRYFQAQGLMHVPTIITVVVAPMNVGLNYLLVWGPESVRLGFIGAPIATATSLTFMSLLYTAYAIFCTSPEAWHPISSKSFTSLPKLLRLALVGVGQNAAEWWSWELISLSASQLGPTTLAAQSILVTSSSTMYMASSALGVASAIRVGNLLGAGDATRAHLTTRVATTIALIQGCIQASIFLVLRSRLAYFFNDDPMVATLVGTVTSLMALYQVTDCMGTTTAGILRACGKLGTAALANFIGYYVIGIPLGVYLAFSYHYGLHGLWIGLNIAICFIAVRLYTTILKLDWNVEVTHAKQRISEEHGGVDEGESFVYV